jgi:hypothetical protein
MAAGPHHEHASTIEHLHALVRQELALLGQVDALSQRQGTLVQHDDPSALLGVLHERQGLIEQTVSIAHEVARLHESCRASAGASGERWRAVQRDMISVAELADRITQRDRSDAERMARKRDECAGGMTQIDKGRGASAAYGESRLPTRPQFQDRHG